MPQPDLPARPTSSSSPTLADPQQAAQLITHLQNVTQALAATAAQDEVFEVILSLTLEALGGIGGVVLLVQGDELCITARQGQDQQGTSIWQDGPLTDPTPATDVLRTRQPLFFSHGGELVAAYPELEAQTGGQAAVASAVLPMVLKEEALGTIVLDFREPHDFTPEEQQFLHTLSAQCAVALGRARLSRNLERQVQERIAALDAFVAFSEASATTTDVYALARHAVEVLRATLGEVGTSYSDLEGDLWKARVWSDNVAPDRVAVLEAGIPASAPSSAEAVRTREVVFVPGGEAEREGAEGSELYGASAFYPCFVGDTPQGLLAMDTQRTGDWTERERSVFRAVGRSLTLALERAEQARQLEAQNTELEARTQALERFAELARSQDTDPLTLTRRAQQAVTELIGDGFAVYYERAGDHWVLKSQVGSPQHPEIQAVLSSALPFGTVQNFRIPWESGEAFYQNPYDPALDGGIPGSETVMSTAVFPLHVGTRRQGIFGYGLTVRRPWSRADKATLQTAVNSLGLALERAEQSRVLEEERVALDAFARFTQAVGTETNVLALAQQATVLLRARFPDASVGYYEPEGELWKPRVWTDDVPEERLAQILAGLPGETPMIAEALQARRAVFLDAQEATPNHIPHALDFKAVANAPLLLNGEVYGVLSVGLRSSGEWRERDQAIVHAVELGLTLALERAEQTQQLDEERAALAAFTTFAETVGSETDVTVLIERAIVLLQATHAVDVIYFERGDEAFTAKSWSHDFPPEVLKVAQVGYPLDQPHLAAAERARDIVFEQAWDPEEQGVPESAPSRAAAFQPFFQGDVMTSTLVIASRSLPRWTERDRGVFRAVGRSLALALERAEQARQLTAQRDLLDVRTQALEAANEELEAFSYSVSHDLRTPVRHIVGFNHLLRKALAERLDPAAERYLSVVDNAAQRMNTLIDAMLDLSRTSRLPLRLTLVDLGAVAERARQDVLLDLSGREVQWVVGQLPMVTGDPDTLQQVLANLLSNALKYSQKREGAVIEVWAEERARDWAVFVRDNGVGFDPRYQDKLFGVFQRLHRQDEFEGVGVGLANVRRIIQRHGGQVWAEGRLGQGATFGFTLLKSE